MDGMEIMNSFKKETFYEFSKAIQIDKIKIYFIFKAELISIEANPSKTKRQRLKKYMKKLEKTETIISHMNIEPIAYILKTNAKENYQIESIDEKYDSFVEKNRNKILEDFLKQL